MHQENFSPQNPSPPCDALKLKAEDIQDLTTLSTYVQDALVPFIGMTHNPTDQTFSVLTHRFRWEKDPLIQAGLKIYERIHSLLRFHHVQNVKIKGVKNSHDPNETLNLLCMTFEKNKITLIFSGDVHVQLHIKKIFVHLDDQNISWPTSSKPSHSAD